MADGSDPWVRIATGFDFPTSIARDKTGTLYVAESGLPFGGAEPGGRIRRINADGSSSVCSATCGRRSTASLGTMARS